MLELKQSAGVTGEFQIIVRRADGSVRLDTGMQKNLILDNGLKFYLGEKFNYSTGAEYTTANPPRSMLWGLAVGSGNREPNVTDTALQNYIAYSNTVRETEWGQVPPTTPEHPNHVKLFKKTKFIFDNLNNKNISELGLIANADTRTSTVGYLLVTRALIKGMDGRPLTITVLADEVLEVVYQINMYVDTRPQTGEFKLTTYPVGQSPDTGVGTDSQFEYIIYPRSIGGQTHLEHPLYLVGNYHTVTTYGVKEADSELTASYDINQTGYIIPYNSSNSAEFHKLTTAAKGSQVSNTNKYLDGHVAAVDVSSDAITGTKTAKYTTGIYSHIHDNGIRAFAFNVNLSASTAAITPMVVLKNKANGQGIKKTNRQIWEFLVSYTLKRWEG